MKPRLRKIFWFILRFFEGGEDAYAYKPLNRKILLAVSGLFNFLALAIYLASFKSEDYGYVFPLLVFFIVGFVCLIVGLLGTDRAVAKIWGSR